MVTKIHNLTFALMAALGCCLSTQAQQQIAVNSASAPTGYGLEVEVVSENIGPLIGALGVTDLTGYSCTRLYITTTNADDFMSSISGDATNPTYVNTTTNFYHAVLGAATPNGINSLLFPVYPDLAYDSWVTIGLEGAPNAAAGEAAVATVQSLDNPWTTNFDTGGGLPGANISIDDPIGGAWYALNGDANGVAGADLKVLVGQFTTTGDLSGQLYAQVFINGDGSNEFRDTFYFPEAPGGCTDPEALNYEPLSYSADGCEYAEVDRISDVVTTHRIETYPSPATDAATVSFPAHLASALAGAELRATALDGRLVQSWTVEGVTQSLDLSGLAAGQYVLTVAGMSDATLRFRGDLVVIQ